MRVRRGLRNEWSVAHTRRKHFRYGTCLLPGSTFLIISAAVVFLAQQSHDGSRKLKKYVYLGVYFSEIWSV